MRAFATFLVRLAVVGVVAFICFTKPTVADPGLDVLVGIIEKASRTDKEIDLQRYFQDDLIAAFKKSLQSPNGGPDFPWWFPRPSYANYELKTIARGDTETSVIIDRDQGSNQEENRIEYVLKKNRNIWKIFDVRELPAKHDAPSKKVDSLRSWLKLK